MNQLTRMMFVGVPGVLKSLVSFESGRGFESGLNLSSKVVVRVRGLKRNGFALKMSDVSGSVSGTFTISDIADTIQCLLVLYICAKASSIAKKTEELSESKAKDTETISKEELEKLFKLLDDAQVSMLKQKIQYEKIKSMSHRFTTTLQ
uniref:Uncharacterized protein n=1 Tax=Timspurckia oligopyrenoides TaxID=708627 RepID=A0A7S0ZBV7_9RHOD|mmetsp:Transcript_11752/g.21264  ORF Transcript_11752/g.21264 Transcript_11752/m.21264 type:complete len:149 (+) Transcript_11752:49-495(+)